MSIKKGILEPGQLNGDDDSDYDEKVEKIELGKPSEGNILVFVRVRPLNAKELSNQDIDIIRVDQQLLVIHNIETDSSGSLRCRK